MIETLEQDPYYLPEYEDRPPKDMQDWLPEESREEVPEGLRHYIIGFSTRLARVLIAMI